MDSRKLVGRNLVRIRRKRGISQEALAHISGFSRQYLSGIEGGRRNPTVHVLDILAEALEVTPVDLLKPDRRSGSHSEPV